MIHLHAVKFQIMSRQSFDYEAYLARNCTFVNPNATNTCMTGEIRYPEPGPEWGWKDSAFISSYEVLLIVFSATTQVI